MAASIQTELDEKLLNELREMAREGKETKALVGRISQALRLPAHAMVPVLAYLCRAFSVPLPVVLPLREDEGEGAFGRAIQIAFWFSAALPRGDTVATWDWDLFWKEFGGAFDADEMQTDRVANGSIQFVVPPNHPDDKYVRAALEVYIDKVAALGPDPKALFQEVRRFESAIRARIGNVDGGSLLLFPEYQIEEQGPKYRVVCMLRALQIGRRPAEAAAIS
jgi:hypothetical protein